MLSFPRIYTLKSLERKVVAYTLGVFLLFGFSLCTTLSVPMPVHAMGGGQGTTSLCPLMGSTSPCPDALAHHGYFEILFTAIPVLLVIMLATYFFRYGFKSFFGRWGVTADCAESSILFSCTSAPPPTLLQELFARGILHSKAF